MELTFERDDLLYALQVLQGVASGRNTLPILSNVLIHAQENTIECVATDLEIGIRIKVEGTITEDGAITVSAKKLGDIVKELPNDEPINLATTANDRVELTCGDGVYKIIGMSDEEFPQLPTIEGDPVSVGGETLRSLLQKTEYAASTEEVRYYLNGLYFNFLEHKTEVVATDGNRLAVAYCEPLNSPGETKGFIVPLKAVKEIERTFQKSGEVDVSLSENQILFKDDNATLTARLVEGDYPNYEKIIPEMSEGRTVVAKDRILRATRRVSVLSNPKNFSISLEIDPEEIRVSTKTPTLGEAHETLPVESGTGSVRIGFDARLLTEALSHIETESVSIEFSGEFNPVILKPVGSEDYISVIMPMRLEPSAA